MDISNFGFLLNDVSRLYRRQFERHTSEIGVSLAQAKVLAYLARNEGTTQVQLAVLCDIDPMTLVRLLDRMENDAWIERRADSGDRRVRRLYLGPPAQAMLDSISGLAKQARAIALAGLSAEDRQHLLRLMEHVHGRLGDAEAKESAAVSLPVSARRPPQRKRGAK